MNSGLTTEEEIENYHINPLELQLFMGKWLQSSLFRFDVDSCTRGHGNIDLKCMLQQYQM